MLLPIVLILVIVIVTEPDRITGGKTKQRSEILVDQFYFTPMGSEEILLQRSQAPAQAWGTIHRVTSAFPLVVTWRAPQAGEEELSQSKPRTRAHVSSIGHLIVHIFPK